MSVRGLAVVPFIGLLALAGRSEGIERLAWMAGCWQLADGDRTVEEQWMAPRGGSMMGMSRTVRGGKTIAWETVLLREDSTGTISYNAFPSGQAATVFPAAEVSDSHAVFSNPAHDFPQRIIYRRRGDTLTARVEGATAGGTRGSDFPYRKVACPGEAGGGRH